MCIKCENRRVYCEERDGILMGKDWERLRETKGYSERSRETERDWRACRRGHGVFVEFVHRIILNFNDLVHIFILVFSSFKLSFHIFLALIQRLILADIAFYSIWDYLCSQQRPMIQTDNATLISSLAYRPNNPQTCPILSHTSQHLTTWDETMAQSKERCTDPMMR